MKRAATIILMSLIWWGVSGPSAGGADGSGADPWTRISRSGSLSDAQKAVLKQALTGRFNYGNCRDPIWSCLSLESPDPIAVVIANFCATLAANDLTSPELLEAIDERARFAKSSGTAALNLEQRPSYGALDAPLVVVEFAEFKCPFCQMNSTILKALVDDSGGMVRCVFKHFPIKSHKGTVGVSMAAEAAHRQGKFWEMFTLIYRDPDHQDRKDLAAYARKLGLDEKQFNIDAEDEAVRKIVELDKIDGLKAGVTGTPTLFINGKHYTLRFSDPFLRSILNEEALRMGKPAPYKVE